VGVAARAGRTVRKRAQETAIPQQTINWTKTFRALAGVLLGAIGLLYCLPTPYHEKTYLIHASGCDLVTSVVEPPGGIAQGYVILLHGLAANRKIMTYLARNFAEQGLRVYMPDLPGHGRTTGPFSPARAEECSEALLKDLLAHGAIVADKTVLAGHSMGGAIAIRVAARERVAGVIAISPAPMRVAHGTRPEVLLFTDLPPLPNNTLVFSGGLEPDSLQGNARDLFKDASSANSKYEVVPYASHVSLLFNKSVGEISRTWSASLLHLEPSKGYVSRSMLWGSLAGFIGILLIATPFLQEACGSKKLAEAIRQESKWVFAMRLGEFAVVSLGAVGLLKYWNPLRGVGLFEGDYLASFFLLSGVVLVAMHWKELRDIAQPKLSTLFSGAFAAIVVVLLITAWFELTITEAWLTSARWPRFPLLLMAVFPYCLAEELLLGPIAKVGGWKRVAGGFLLRLIGWLAIIVGLLALHSSEILILLLAPYLALFYLLQRRGMDVVREGTGSPTVAALFGAILLSGLCMVIFPVT
jgi:pimeloyl-ACP methyl ester carboxylesterase